MAAILSASKTNAQDPGSLFPPLLLMQSPRLPAATISPKVPPDNPEQIGDALMAHQRYQAAIEAYKKAPQTHRLSAGTRPASLTN